MKKFQQRQQKQINKNTEGNNGIEKRFNKEIIYFPNWAEKEIEDNIITELNEIIFPENKFIIMYSGTEKVLLSLILILVYFMWLQQAQQE